MKKLGPWKSQLELQKKQMSELQLKLDEERKTADKFELQFKNLLEKNETLTQEKEVAPTHPPPMSPPPSPRKFELIPIYFFFFLSIITSV